MRPARAFTLLQVSTKAVAAPARSWTIRRLSAVPALTPPTKGEMVAKYVAQERKVMEKLHVESQTSFRASLAFIIASVAGGVWYFWPYIKGWVSGQTADVATATLADRQLQAEAQRVAKTLVDDVLRDPEIFKQAKTVILNLLQTQETKETLRRVIIDTLRDPATVHEVQNLAKNLVREVLNDDATKQQFVQIVKAALADPVTRAGVVEVAKVLMAHPDTKAALAELLGNVTEGQAFRDKIIAGLSYSIHQTLDKPDVRAHALAFVKSVLTDHQLQQTGGDALWNTLVYSLKPHWGRKKDHDANTPTPSPTADAAPTTQTQDTSESQPEPTTPAAEPAPEAAAPPPPPPPPPSADLYPSTEFGAVPREPAFQLAVSASRSELNQLEDLMAADHATLTSK